MTDSPDRFKGSPRYLSVEHTTAPGKGDRRNIHLFAWPPDKRTAVASGLAGQPVTRRACLHEPDTHEHTRGGHRDE